MNKKNWTFYATTDTVFWDANTTDKPSLEYIENMNWEKIDMNLHHISPYVVRTQLNSDQYGLIKAVNKTTSKEIYYILKNIVMFTDDNYNLEYELDTWTTYNLKMLDLDINVLVERHQDYDDDKCLNFTDSFLENNNLTYENFEFIEKIFNQKIENNYVIFETDDKKSSIKIDKNNLVNGCFCLVINDTFSGQTVNNAFTFIPILSTSSKSIVNSVGEKVEQQVIEFVKGNTSYNDYNRYFWGYNTTKHNVTIANHYGKNYYKQNIDYYDEKIANQFYADFVWRAYGVNNKGDFLEKTKNIGYLINQYDLDKISLEAFYPTGSSGGKYSWYCHNQTPILIEEWKWPGYLFENFNNQLIINYFKQKPIINEVVNNSWLEISKIAKNHSTKVMGVFISPNVMNLNRLWDVIEIDNKKFLTFNISQQGNYFNDIEFENPFKIDNKLRFNNSNIQNKMILKAFDFNYLNNSIDVSKRLQNNTIKIANHVLFTNSFNLRIKNEKIILDNQILTLPNQQPFFVDSFKQYIQSNMNVLNTGYEIQKQQSVLGGLQNGINGLINIGQSFAGGDFIGGVSKSINGVFGQVNNALSFKNYEKQIKSAIKDRDNVMGNNLLFSATKDTIFNEYLVEKPLNYELLYYKKLSNDSIIQLNNYFLLNGVYNPKYFKLNDLPKTTKHLGFYYAKLNTTNFNQVFSKHINETLEIKDIILANFAEFRVWDKIPSIE